MQRLNKILGAVVLACSPMLALAQANISNGTVSLGIRADGALMPTSAVGITYLPTGNDGLTPGCLCEAWGIADLTSNQSGYTGANVGTSNISNVSFTSTASSATSVVTAFGVFRVTHAYAPSASANVFEVKVTIENISAAPAHVQYGRAMDWDVDPTRFNEYTTIQRGSSPAIVFSSDNGFHNANPLNPDSGIQFTNQDVNTNGPDDHGAHFRFDFGTIAPGAKVEFTIGYGAAGSETEAMAALGTFGAEAYSLGKPSQNAAGAASTDGTPNTFIFAFKGIGGVQLLGVDAVNDTPPAIGIPSAPVVLTNVLTNDTVDAAAATPGNVTVTPSGAWPAGISIGANGDVTVAPTATAGTHVLSYQICSTAQPTQCDTATVTVQLTSGGVVTPGSVQQVPVNAPLTLGALAGLLALSTRRKSRR